MLLLQLLDGDAPPAHRPPPLEPARRAHQQRHARARQRQALRSAEERVVGGAAGAVKGEPLALRLVFKPVVFKQVAIDVILFFEVESLSFQPVAFLQVALF